MENMYCSRVDFYCLLIPFLAFLLSVPDTSLNTQANEKTIAEFTVHSGEFARTNTPVTASLDGIPLELESGDLQLFEITEEGEEPVVSQLDGKSDKVLRWILEGKTPVGTTRNYILKSVPADTKAESPERKSVRIEDDGKSLTLKIDEKNVLSYRYAKKSPPEGVSELYARGGYIHPLWSPAGEVLTRIQPPDHYHHYGIWNPWTHTEFEGKEIDFWNLGDGEGTVRPESLPLKTSGDVFGGFEAVLNHVDLNNASSPSGEKIALKEKWEVKVWNVDPENEVWLIDFASNLNPASDSQLTIKEYRYQGFSIRATEKWSDETATLLTSQGKDKSNGNGTRARWTDINGVSEVGTSGILMMTHPGNYNYPELLRIWPTGANEGKENVYFNFNPAQDRDWELKPGNTYSLKYRMMVYDGKIDPEDAERYWRDFAHPPKVDVTNLSLSGSKVLVYTKNGEGYVHENIPNSVEAIRELGEQYGFTVEHSEDPGVFTDKNLQQYDAIIFSNTNNETVDTEKQKKAFQNYIRSGGGFVGIHSASGSERNWAWYWKLLGGTFHRHAPFQEFTVEVADKSHASTSFLPARWEREDECYYLKQMNPDMNVILQADLNSVEDEEMGEYPGDTFGDTFPLAWHHEFDGGRSWYTSLGHSTEDYDDPLFVRHILGGIQWAVNGGSQ